MVLFAAVLLASTAYGKPYSAEQFADEKEQSSAEAILEPQQDMNETSGFRGKRDASAAEEYLKNYCSQKLSRRSQPRHPCEAGSFACHNYMYVEVVCNRVSFACLSSIPKVGIAKCVPKCKWVTIDLGSLGKRQVRRTYACSCA